MGFWIVIAVICALLVCGAAVCLFREKHNMTRKRGYYIGKELRHGAGWFRLIVRGTKRTKETKLRRVSAPPEKKPVY